MYFTEGSAGWVLPHTPGRSPALSPELCRGSFLVAAALNAERNSWKAHTGGGNEEITERKGTGLLTVQHDLMFCLNLQKCKYLTAVLVLFFIPLQVEYLFTQHWISSFLSTVPSLYESKTAAFWQGLKDENRSKWELWLLLKLHKSFPFTKGSCRKRHLSFGPLFFAASPQQESKWVWEV